MPRLDSRSDGHASGHLFSLTLEREVHPEPDRRGTTRGFSDAGFHETAYVEWGTAAGDPVICAHGLTGQGRDFDYLAARLASAARGRGGSE